jgi:hypothetical protein
LLLPSSGKADSCERLFDENVVEGEVEEEVVDTGNSRQNDYALPK